MLLGLGRRTHQQLQDAFASHDIPFGEKIDTTNFSYTTPNSVITIGAGMTDLYEPVEVWQRLNSSSEWLWVNRVFRLKAPPVQNPYLYLTDWDWSNSQINVIPAQNSMQIMVRYVRQIARATDATVQLSVTGFYNPFVAGVCWRAARATKRFEEAADFKQEFFGLMEQAILRASRRMQSIPQRWGGYRAHRGRGMSTPLVTPTP